MSPKHWEDFPRKKVGEQVFCADCGRPAERIYTYYSHVMGCSFRTRQVAIVLWHEEQAVKAKAQEILGKISRWEDQFK